MMKKLLGWITELIYEIALRVWSHALVQGLWR